MNQTLREQLKDWERNNREYRSKPQKRRTEVLTDSDKEYYGNKSPCVLKRKGRSLSLKIREGAE